MAGISTSMLANLLVSVASHEHDDQSRREQTAQKDDYEAHMKCRTVTRENAERKAWSLSKHRPVLVRWTSPSGNADAKYAAATSNSRRRSRKDAPGAATADKNKNDNSSGDGSSSSGGSGDTSNDVLTIFRSGLLSLVSAEGQGRHLVAGAAAIPARTVLLIERPYAWSLQPEFAGNTCAECLREVAGAATLCPDCGSVAFCSIACAIYACRTWHGSECVDASGAPLEPAISAISPTCQAALRALRRAKQDELLGGNDAAPSVVTGDGSNVSSTTVRDATPSINLADLEEQYILRPPWERNVMETEAAIAAVLASGGCPGVDAESVGAGERKLHSGRGGCGALAAEVVTSLFKIDTNAFDISTLRCSEATVGNMRSMTHTKLGVGLFLETAMFNHSCAPNALVTFNGKELRVVATRLIKKGEPVTISYGPLASKVASAYERRAVLQKTYFFTCNCSACSPEMTNFHRSNERTSPHDGAAARSTMTEFACMDSDCPGTLLLGIPPPPRKTRLHGQIHEEIDAFARAAVAPVSSSSQRALWCDCCGAVVPPALVDELLTEDGEDHRLWEEATAAVAYSEGQSDQKELSRHHQHRNTKSSSSSRPAQGRVSPRASESSAEVVVSATAVAAALVHKCASWRDRRLSCRARRRSIAHDTHARLLAVDGNFAGAAEALTRAIDVLANNFALEDRELGFEYLKLAEVCFNAGWAERCMAACQKARVSLELCLAPGDEQLGSLNNMQAVCASYR